MKIVIMILPLALLLCFTVSCQDKAAMAELEDFRAQAALEAANKALAERYIDVAFNKPDLDALKEILSPDYVHHPQLGTDESLDEALRGLQERTTRFPDQAITIEDMFVKGNKIALRCIFSGTYTDDIEDFPATGKKVEMRAFVIMRVENSKIAEDWGGRDLLSLYQQLGFELKPKERK
jgi:steroid delta-isomerase-like uncharacterized protein